MNKTFFHQNKDTGLLILRLGIGLPFAFISQTDHTQIKRDCIIFMDNI